MLILYFKFQNEFIHRELPARLGKYEEHIDHAAEHVRSPTNRPTYSNGNYTNDEIADMHQREKQMIFEMKRMEHDTIRLTNEMLSVKREIESIEHHNEGEPTNRAEKLPQLHIELTNRKLQLIEHLKRASKHRTEFEQHRVQRLKCENEMRILRDEMKSGQENQRGTDTIARRKNHERMSINRLEEPLGQEIKLLEQHTERIRGELKLLKNGYESINCVYPWQINDSKKRSAHRSNFDILSWDRMAQQHEQLKKTDINISTPNTQQIRQENTYSNPKIRNYNENCAAIDQAKYDVMLSYANENVSTIERIKNALPEGLSIHIKDNHPSTNIKLCLDNTSTAVIAIINNAYELSTTCEADIIHTFKRQFPLVLVISDLDFKPCSNWLNLIWHAPKTQKVYLNIPNFEENLRTAIANAQWNLSPNLSISKITLSTTRNRSSRFLGNLQEWTTAYRNPARVCHNYRQLINDPFRSATDIKLQDIYRNYIRTYFENTDMMNLFEKGVNRNDMCEFIRGYTYTDSFSTIFSHHLAVNIFFYFGPRLHGNVDYQLVKCLIDFVALCVYRQEFRPLVISGTVYRGMVMSEADILKLVVGSQIMNTTFLSTSKDKDNVEFPREQNQQEFNVLCTYVINNNNNRRTALDIAYLSSFPGEREVLILPLSAFYVKSITRSLDKPKLIEIVFVEEDFDIFMSMDNKVISIRI
jgi:hypothetical protein